MADIQIVRFDSVTGLATVGMGIAPKILRGMDKLKQIVALEYLRNPGQSVIQPDEGSGLRAAIGQYNIGGDSELKTLFVQRTLSVEKSIVSRQETTAGPPTEKLKKLTVLDVATDAFAGSMTGRVQVINQVGDEIDILV